MKVRGVNWIRYLSSFGRKCCVLGVAPFMRRGSVEMKMLSTLFGKYGCKIEILRNWRGSTTRGGACGLI